MVKIEVESLVVVRRTVINTADRPGAAVIDEAFGQRGGFSPRRALPTRPTPRRFAVTASSLLALAGIALGEVARRRSGRTALPRPPVVEALPSSVGRIMRSPPAGPRASASNPSAAALPDEQD